MSANFLLTFEIYGTILTFVGWENLQNNYFLTARVCAGAERKEVNRHGSKKRITFH